MAAVTKKVLDAKNNKSPLKFWGTGKPRREALFSEDGAEACIYLMENYDGEEIVNIGTGFDYSIKEYVKILANLLKVETKNITWDTSKPEGTYEKRTDITILKKIMPKFQPRTFQEGVKIVLKEDFNIEI